MSGPDNREIGWGVAGTGRIAHHFASDLALVAGCRLRGAASRSFEKAEAFAARHGGSAHRDLASLLADDRIDAIYVASPNDTHRAVAHAALAAGKAVMVEKPLAVSPAEAEQLAAFAAGQGLFLMEGMWTRFLPAVAFVREAMHAGAIGEVRRLRGELAFRRDPAADGHFFDPARGGGALLDLGVYPISLSLHLMGRPRAVRGRWRAAPGGADMSAEITLSFGEAEAHLACGFDRDGANLFVVEGSKGSLILQPPFIGARMVVEAKASPARLLAEMEGSSALARAARKLVRTAPLPGLRRHGFDFQGYGLHFEIAAAATAIAAGATGHPLAPPSDSVETLRIVEQVLADPPAR